MRENLRKSIVFALSALAFLAPLKFTQIVQLDSLTPWPHGLEWLTHLWPSSAFYAIHLLLLGLSIPLWKQSLPTRRMPIGLAWVFLLIQILATLGSMNRAASFHVLEFFFSITVAFTLGQIAIQTHEDLEWITFAWVAATVVTVWLGWLQVTGGREQALIQLLHQPDLITQNPLIRDWAESDRIYAAFVTPNALAGYLVAALCILPAWLFLNTSPGAKKPVLTLSFLVLLALAVLFCLWRTQSKSGFLILVITSLLAAFLLSATRRRAIMAMGVLIVAALLLFALGYMRPAGPGRVPRNLLDQLDIAPHKRQPALERGAQSLHTRLAFWNAALKITRDHPLLGSGPGTFGILYPNYKKPEDLSTRLVHNSYLQMATESGVPGFCSYLAWFGGALWMGWRRIRQTRNAVSTLLWCACFSFAVQSLVDFNLYMPGLAWPIFLILGHVARDSR